MKFSNIKKSEFLSLCFWIWRGANPEKALNIFENLSFDEFVKRMGEAQEGYADDYYPSAEAGIIKSQEHGEMWYYETCSRRLLLFHVDTRTVYMLGMEASVNFIESVETVLGKACVRGIDPPSWVFQEFLDRSAGD